MFERQGEQVWGSAERYEIRHMSLRGRMDGGGPTGHHQTSTFRFKYPPRPDGSGFDHPPVPVHVAAEVNVRAAERGEGELALRDSPHDPVALS